MKRIIYTHRFVFAATWLLGIIALIFYPGFEIKGLVFGLVIGYWPFALCGECGDTITLLSMFILSAIEVGLCAWVMDKCNIAKKIWVGLLFAIIAGVSIAYYLNADQFDAYKTSQWVVAAENTPELNYEFTLSDFNELYLIPQVIVGGMIGLYLTSALGFLYAMGMILFKKRHLTRR